MAYNKKEILKQAIAAIKKHELTTMNEVMLYLPMDISTLYISEDWQFEFVEPVKKELEAMKTGLKAKMKKKWQKSKAPILQIAAFKLMANEEEKEALAPPKLQIKKGDGDDTVIVKFTD